MKFYDSHVKEEVEMPLVALTLKKGRTGVAVVGHISSINAFDFEGKRLSRESIGGVIDLRQNISEAVVAYNKITIESSQITAWELLG